MNSSSKFPMELADRCVKCGLCLPHCPTYRLAGVEGESPRGRIALMQGLATGRLAAGNGLVQHLEQCLGCRACETVCPAGVPYGELIDAGRAMLVERGIRPPPAQRALRVLLRHRRWLNAAVRVARWPGMLSAARRLGGLPRRAAELLPDSARAVDNHRESQVAGPVRGEAQLFAGCVGAAVDGRSLDDVRRALVAGGWRVTMPPRQRCCGAMDLHAGRPAAAGALAHQNLAAFTGDGPVVACASGCAATLLEYARLGGRAGAVFARRVRDPAELLLESPLEPKPGRYRDVVLHVPCTQRNVTGTAPATRRLLASIPGVRIRELPAGCCGAAGEMFLSRPDLADALLEPCLAELQQAPPDALVTSNVGCLMHFTAGLARVGLNFPVLHPASLIADALE